MPIFEVVNVTTEIFRLEAASFRDAEELVEGWGSEPAESTPDYIQEHRIRTKKWVYEIVPPKEGADDP